MRIRSLVSVGLVAALAVACKQGAKDAGGPARPGSGAAGSAGPGSAAVGSGAAPGSGAACSGAASSDAPSAPGAGISVTLRYSVDPSGSRWTETQTKRIVLDIEAGGQKLAMVQEATLTHQLEVLAASEAAVTRAKVTFVEVSEKQTMGDKAKAKPAPHAGKAYLLEADPSGAVKVTAADGAAVGPDEEAAVKDDVGNFGKPEKMGKALDGMTFELGKRVEVPVERARGAFGDDGKMTVDLLALTLTKVDGSQAWFDLELVASTDLGKGAMMKMRARGPVHLDVTVAKPLDMALEGTVEMTGAARATGTMKMTGTRARG